MKAAITILLITLAIVIFYISVTVSKGIDFNNDPNNCGALDNRCEQGFMCVDAVCVK